MVNILTRAIMMSTPLLLGALAEVYAERTGMMICAIEGIFLIGAWGGFVGTYLSGSLLVGLLLAIALGGLMALLYAFVTVTLGQQQVVTGTAMNILAVGFCSYFQRVLFGVPTTPLQIDTLPKLSIPLLSKIPFIGEIFFQQNILTYMAYILIPVSIFVLYKTSLGLAIRSTGENPVAVDVAGLPVNRIRFLTVLVAGCIGGLAGSFYTVGYLGMFSSNIIGGRGWIAFAICFLGNWSPKGAVLGTLAFGLADALSIYFRTGTTAVPTELIIALPYILTIVLTIFRSNFRVPAKLGVPYRKEGRVCPGYTQSCNMRKSTPRGAFSAGAGVSSPRKCRCAKCYLYPKSCHRKNKLRNKKLYQEYSVTFPGIPFVSNSKSYLKKFF